jgi:hypothetical protein
MSYPPLFSHYKLLNIPLVLKILPQTLKNLCQIFIIYKAIDYFNSLSFNYSNYFIAKKMPECNILFLMNFEYIIFALPDKNCLNVTICKLPDE